ncbi:two-component response regulator ORR26-like [Solanum stenotomum]|uniref:two-component response regulator ORR26-like n=1 Tax=Solanum stenotomum TaxID=172797 RepID=UPI0020D034E4|nr:two-component response regulator ORR26-like [Solanum stenotomum]
MAPAAMSMLSKEKKKIDAMIINVISPNSHCFELLAQAVALNIIVVIVVYDELNEFLVKKALDNGAYICSKKPLVEQTVTFLWQTQRDHINVGDEERDREKNMLINTEEQSNNNNVVSNGKHKLRRKRGRKSTKEINEGNKTIMHKDCLKWTDDLRVKFTEVVEQLGDGRCFPSDIREMMNMPGLTIKQISSRLQKCRSKDEKLQEEREYICLESSSGSQQRSSYDTSLERTKRRNSEKSGKMPRLQTNVPNQTQRVPEFPPVYTNNIFAIEGSDPNEWQYWDAFVNYNSMDDIYQLPKFYISKCYPT